MKPIVKAAAAAVEPDVKAAAAVEPIVKAAATVKPTVTVKAATTMKPIVKAAAAVKPATAVTPIVKAAATMKAAAAAVKPNVKADAAVKPVVEANAPMKPDVKAAICEIPIFEPAVFETLASEPARCELPVLEADLTAVEEMVMSLLNKANAAVTDLEVSMEHVMLEGRVKQPVMDAVTDEYGEQLNNWILQTRSDGKQAIMEIMDAMSGVGKDTEQPVVDAVEKCGMAK